MKLFRLPLLCILFLLSKLHAQVSSDYAVLLSANVSDAPAQITISWPLYANATGYDIYKKELDDVSWGSPIYSTDGAATFYADADVTTGIGYEYKVVRNSTSGIIAEGYIHSGIQLPVIDARGTCLLVIDTTITATLGNAITRLKDDLSGDGWKITELHISRDMSVATVRDLIIAVADADTALQSLFLLGRVPVPYSGNMNPDGHPEHQGAWPADGIYGDVNSDYTDATINNATAARPENWNVPGDGKYDQNVFKSKVELMTGRVDMYNMISFGADEAGLLQRYLDNDHAYRNDEWHYAERALIDDNFGAFAGEAFASSGWRNFGPLTGNTNMLEADYFTTMRDSTYVWSYGCGGGWYQGAGGVGSSSDFIADTVKTAFTMLFGSYFGDWDNADNFLRAPLAGGTSLINCWAGRPHWHFHHMGLGQTTGYAARITQNNSSTYVSNIFPKWTHIALMGDPTLRMYPIAPVADMYCTLSPADEQMVDVFFSPSPAPDVIGYHIYRATEKYGVYERVTETPVTASPQTIYGVQDGVAYNYYQVRPVRLEETPSGTFYNTGTGKTDSVSVPVSIVSEVESSLHIFPSPANNFTTIYGDANMHDVRITIYRQDGAAVQTISADTFPVKINTSDLAAGVYIADIAGYKLRFVVMHD